MEWLIAAVVLLSVLVAVVAWIRRARATHSGEDVSTAAEDAAGGREGDTEGTVDGSEAELSSEVTIVAAEPYRAKSDALTTVAGVAGVTVAADDTVEEFGGANPLSEGMDGFAVSSGRVLVTAYGSTDPGLRRTNNEDAILGVRDELFAVADGMGGHEAGEIASQIAVDTLTAAFETEHFGGAAIAGLPRAGDELVRALRLANREIHEHARSAPKRAGMGTTVVAVRFSSDRRLAFIANVGDSRCYRIRAGQGLQLTRDHTLAALGVSGKGANSLLRSVGVDEQLNVDLTVDEPDVGDVYLLCSDGLTSMVPEERVCAVVAAESDLECAVQSLIDEAKEAGGRDNVSVILVRVDEAGR